MAVTDQELVEHIVRGDPEAARLLVERWSGPLYNFAYRMTGSAEDARDLVQDSLLKALRHLGDYDPRWALSTWLYRIARNTHIDRRRRLRPATELDEERFAGDEAGEAGGPSGFTSPLRAALEREESELIQKALARLRDNYREIIVLYHFEALSYREIADLLDIPLGTVMNRLFRARNMLREALAELEYTP
ncbi:sigma-70 family RNA polymerase sigma factor [Myxococcota bacterium]|nr:sigma-70 family RNA polymerase sigma factor [Myxococcota bacterium]